MTIGQFILNLLYGLIGGQVGVTLLALIIKGPRFAWDYLLGRL